MTDMPAHSSAQTEMTARSLMTQHLLLQNASLQEDGIRPSDETYTVRGLLAMLRRHKLIIASSMVVLTTLATIVAFTLTPRYTAEAMVILDTRRPEIVQQSAVLSNLVNGSLADPAVVRSEVAIISSPAFVSRIVDKLDLLNNPDFQRDMSPTLLETWLRQSSATVGGWIRALRGDSTVPERGTPMGRAISFLDRRLSVYNDERSYAIRLRYESRDPAFAALIVNTVAQVYMADQLAAKQDVSRRASIWLKGRLEELAAKVRHDQQLVSSFEADHHLATVLSGNLAEQQLHDLNMQLMAATNERVQKEAALAQVQAMLRSPNGAAGAAQVLASPLIQKLREQEAEAAAHLDPRGDVRAQEIGRRIAMEIQRVTASLAGEVATATTREATLRAKIESLRADLNDMNTARIRLRDLERDATASRSLYDSFMLRAQQVEADEQSLQPDARILEAVPPDTASFPNKPLLIAFGALASVFVGVALALLRERVDQSLRAPDTIERVTGVRSLGMVPKEGNGARALSAVVSAPLSPYSESLRNVLVALRAGTPYSAHRVIAVTSALMGEGKTVLSTSLARAAAASGCRALLIDCDMRRPAVARLLASRISQGQSKAPEVQRSRFSKDIKVDDVSGLHYLTVSPALLKSEHLLTSAVITDLIDWARTEYDMIVLDTPPLLAMSDAVLLSRVADSTVLVVRWGRTSATFVTEAIRLLQRESRGPIGTVLSMVNAKHYLRSRGAEFYYQPRHTLAIRGAR